MAGRTLCIHPSSRIARENLEVFCDTWAANVNDLSRIAKDLDSAASKRVMAEKQAYMSLPRPGVSCCSNSPCSLHSFCSDLHCGGRDDLTNNYCGVLSFTNPYGRHMIRENSYADSGYKSVSELPKDSPTFNEKYDKLLLANFCQQMNIHQNNKRSKNTSDEIIYSTINKDTILNKSNENLMKSPSAFVKYNRSQTNRNNDTKYLENKKDDLNTVLRQKDLKTTYNRLAPLAKLEDFEDTEFQDSPRKFENRMSRILDDLKLEQN